MAYRVRKIGTPSSLFFRRVDSNSLLNFTAVHILSEEEGLIVCRQVLEVALTSVSFSDSLTPRPVEDRDLLLSSVKDLPRSTLGTGYSEPDR